MTTMEDKTKPSPAEEMETPVAEEIDQPEADLVAALEQELAAEKERCLRLAAEYDNYRKRSQKEREGLYADVKSNVVQALLPVYDNLERALAQESTDEALYKGLEMTMSQFHEVFEKLGVTKIPALGEKFDPVIHNAVLHIQDEAYGENEIVEQFQTGFQLGDKIIRHSMVKVAN
ncbi:MAG: nucleotide exchange factor GrpE [Oscillospiraceae bacterium]|nr:nucleotide exchange factor GrpE [Oscillospiraceae bacterium]